jgi:hypothetical protein
MLERFFVDAAHSFMKDDEHKFEDDKSEGFANHGPVMGDDLASMVGRILALLFVLLLISFFGQYFWNNYVVSLFSIAKPAKSVMQILGLFIFVRLMFP